MNKEIFFNFDNFINYSGINISYTLLNDIKTNTISKFNKKKYNLINSLIILIDKKYLLFTNGVICKIDINKMQLEKFTKIQNPNGTICSFDNTMFLFKRNSQKIPEIENINVLDKNYNLTKKLLNIYLNFKTFNNEIFINVQDTIYKQSKLFKLKLLVNFENNSSKTKVVNNCYVNNLKDFIVKDIEYSDAVYIIIQNKVQTFKIKISYNLKTKIKNIDMLLNDEKEYIFVQQDINIEEYNNFQYVRGEKLVKLIENICNMELEYYPLNNHCSIDYYNNLYERLNGYVCNKTSDILRVYELDNKFAIKNKLVSLKSEELIKYKYPMSPYYVGTVPSILKYNNNYLYYAKLRFTSHSKLIQYSESKDLRLWSKLENIKLNTINYNNDEYCIPNIFRYPNTNYIIGFPYNYSDDRTNIIISNDGIEFDDLYSLDWNNTNKCIVVNNFFELDNNHIILNCNYNDEDIILTKYTLRKDSLFYVESKGYGYFLTKLLRIYNNQVIINYKCETDGYIIINFLDEYKNSFQEPYKLDKEKTEETIDINAEFIYLDVRIVCSSIFSVTGKFIEEDKNNNKIQITYALFGKKSDYQNKIIPLDSKYKSVIGDIIYNTELTTAKIKLLDFNDIEKELVILELDKPFNIIDIQLI